jgi:hypothetical protein
MSVPEIKEYTAMYTGYIPQFSAPYAGSVCESRALPPCFEPEQKAVFARRMFLGSRGCVRHVKGVIAVRRDIGRNAKTRSTRRQQRLNGHAESVEIRFDPAKVITSNSLIFSSPSHITDRSKPARPGPRNAIPLGDLLCECRSAASCESVYHRAR